MTNLMKRQIHTNTSTFLFIILDLFWLQNQIQWKKLSGKTYSYYYIYVWFKNKRVRTSSDEFGRNLTKIFFLRKSLRIFSKTFCLFDLLCLTNFWCQPFRKRPIKKKATVKGRPRPSIFHPNLPKILEVTSPFLGQAI